MLDGLEWSRPVGFLALLLPVVVLLASRLLNRPLPRATGTLAIWRTVRDHRRTEGARRRFALPLSTWLLLCALSAGALALAGPVRTPRAVATVLECVVDASPSMYLEHSAGRTRLDVAVAQLADSFEEQEVVWIRPLATGAERVEGRAFPSAWRTAPRPPLEEPRFEEWDGAGRVFVTDRMRPRDVAGESASGGALVPGPLAVRGRTEFHWTGEAIVERATEQPARLSIRGADRLAAEVLEFARTWAAAREFELSAAEGCELELAFAQDGELREDVPLTRVLAPLAGGWSGTADAVPVPLDARAPTIWLRAGDAPVVAHGPGSVRCGIARLGELTGDPAAFAVDWAELFDRAVLPPARCVPLEERAAAGDGGLEAPREAKPLEAPLESPPYAAWLAGAASVLALAALVTRRG